LLVIVLVNLN